MTPAQEKLPVFTLDKSTLVPLGLLIAVVLAATGGTWQLSSVLHEFKTEQSSRDHEFALKFQRIEIQLQQVQDTVTLNGADRWRRSDMREWVALLKANNPTMTVPEVTK